MTAVLERPTLGSGFLPPVPPRNCIGLAHGPMDDDSAGNSTSPEENYPEASGREYIPLFSEVSEMIKHQINQIGYEAEHGKTPALPPTPNLIALFNEQKDLPEDEI